MTKHIDFVMTRLPNPDGEFVELEDDAGRGLGPQRGAEWVERENGLVALRVTPDIFGPEVRRESADALDDVLMRFSRSEIGTYGDLVDALTDLVGEWRRS